LDKFLFIILMDIPAEHEDAFNYIYDNDHLGHMMKVPGNQRCDRYGLVWSDNGDMQRYLAVYEIDDPELPRSDVWRERSQLGKWPTDMRANVVNRASGVFRQIADHGFTGSAAERENVYFLLQGIPPELDERFNALYDGDHVPYMLQTPGAQSCRRFRREWTMVGELPDYLAIYSIAGPDTPRSPEWKMQTAKGVWPTEMRPNFTARRNGSYRRIAEHLSG